MRLALADAENLEMRTSEYYHVLVSVRASEGLAKHVDSFMQMLSLMDPKERTPLILAPLLSDSLLETNRPFPRILSTMEHTYTGLQNNQSSYSTFCSAIGGTATSDLSCFSSSNIDVFVDSIKQLDL
ncbi:hypothetical protein Dsin_015015 [Dipteronia sinensis]|uniref:Uncharacterized protein n=1 Tax=Dipteronia sinensis TaxID=43782 RepID=A0AAE0ANP8_9ROSI|nr:hypothetical protein Dsin_015015 [Dipteronia sinensis]